MCHEQTFANVSSKVRANNFVYGQHIISITLIHAIPFSRSASGRLARFASLALRLPSNNRPQRPRRRAGVPNISSSAGLTCATRQLWLQKVTPVDTGGVTWRFTGCSLYDSRSTPSNVNHQLGDDKFSRLRAPSGYKAAQLVGQLINFDPFSSSSSSFACSAAPSFGSSWFWRARGRGCEREREALQ